MDALLLQLLNGLDKGGAYALIALGLTLIFGTLGVVNFAHGALFMLGAFCAVTLQKLLTISQRVKDESITFFDAYKEIPYLEIWYGETGSMIIDYAVPHLQPHECEGYRYVNGAALRYSPRDTDLTFCHDVGETMPACLAAAIIHAREEMPDHECGEIDIAEVEPWWERATRHGFRLDSADVDTTTCVAAVAS